jgi:hypothetical protein
VVVRVVVVRVAEAKEVVAMVAAARVAAKAAVAKAAARAVVRAVVARVVETVVVLACRSCPHTAALCGSDSSWTRSFEGSHTMSVRATVR